MNRYLLAVFLAITMLFAIPFEGYARKASVFVSTSYKAGHGRGHGWGHHERRRHHGWRRHHQRRPHFYWRGSFVIPFPYGYYPRPPVVIQQQPPVYVQPEQLEENYWYYCPDPQGYYPYIRDCASGWMKVVPDATPPNP